MVKRENKIGIQELHYYIIKKEVIITVMGKRVLIALDFNPDAQKVAEAGFSIAREMDAEITLLHLLSETGYYHPAEHAPLMQIKGYYKSGPVEPFRINAHKDTAMHFLDESRKRLGDMSIETMLCEGDNTDSILRSAKGIKADLIILGSHSRKWIENILIGSLTDEALLHSSIQLLIIPTRQKE